MSSPDKLPSYDSTNSSLPARKGSRWDRVTKEEGNGSDVGSKRKLPSAEAYSQDQSDEPDVKRTSLNTQSQAISFSMGQKSAPKISMNIEGGASQSAAGKMNAPIKLSLGASPKEAAPVLPKPKNMTVAQAFNDDESSDEEEMPPEAKMRMRNLGKDTPTAAGPNSFGKNRLGFCDRQKVIQREMQKKMDDLGKQSE